MLFISHLILFESKTYLKCKACLSFSLYIQRIQTNSQRKSYGGRGPDGYSDRSCVAAEDASLWKLLESMLFRVFVEIPLFRHDYSLSL